MHFPVGTLANSLAIVVGSLAGLAFHGRIPERVRRIVFQGLGICVLVIGLQMAIKMDRPLIVVFSMVLGGVCGELLHLEERFESLGDRIKALTGSGNDRFTEGLVTASLIYCVGSMAILGALDDGLRHDPTLLFTKATLDGFASIPLASTYGVGVAFAAVSVFFYQGSISILAASVAPLVTPQLLDPVVSTGGLIIMCIGLNLLELTRIRLSNFLPALAAAALLSYTPF